MRTQAGDTSNVQRRHFGASRRQRISEAFYENSIEQDTLQEGDTNQCHLPDLATSMQRSYDIKKYEIHQSRRLPQWIWYLLARFLGIKLHPADKPIFGMVMIILTMAFAGTYIVTFAWYIAYDIMNEYTKQTVLTGVFSIVMVIFWVSLGIYANKLAARLFSSQKFLDSVRLHSRTIFKVSAAGLMITLATASTILNNYTAAKLYTGDHCHNLTVSPVVCYVMFGARLGYSIFSLIWNLLVGIVLLSVCRTHTIGIRRFIKQLEEDGHIYELYIRNMCNSIPVSLHSDTTQLGDDEQFEWEDDLSPVADEYCAMPSSRMTPAHTPTHGPRFPGGYCTMENFPPGREPINRDPDLSNVTASCDGVTSGDAKGRTTTTETDVLVDLGEANLAKRDSNPVNLSNTPVPPVTMETAEPSTSQSKAKSGPPQTKQPIIIVKEGSMVTTDEAAVELPHMASTLPLDRLRLERTRATEDCEVSGELPGASTDKTQLINPDPPSYASRSTQHSLVVELNSPRRLLPSTSSLSLDQRSSVDHQSVEPNMLTPDSILLCYWRIGCRLRTTSIALQRWLVAWICFILAWSLSFIVNWIHHEATLMEIAAFVLPILLIPLVCSAYGEVNMEGKRMIQSVCPTEERVQMLMFLENQPLQLMAFGFPISYSTIVKTVGAVLVAFGTKIVLEELNIFK